MYIAMWPSLPFKSSAASLQIQSSPLSTPFRSSLASLQIQSSPVISSLDPIQVICSLASNPVISTLDPIQVISSLASNPVISSYLQSRSHSSHLQPRFNSSHLQPLYNFGEIPQSLRQRAESPTTSFSINSDFPPLVFILPTTFCFCTNLHTLFVDSLLAEISQSHCQPDNISTSASLSLALRSSPSSQQPLLTPVYYSLHTIRYTSSLTMSSPNTPSHAGELGEPAEIPGAGNSADGTYVANNQQIQLHERSSMENTSNVAQAMLRPPQLGPHAYYSMNPAGQPGYMTPNTNNQNFMPPVMQPGYMMPNTNNQSFMPPVMQPGYMMPNTNNQSFMPPVMQPGYMMPNTNNQNFMPPVMQPGYMTPNTNNQSFMPPVMQPGYMAPNVNNQNFTPPAMQLPMFPHAPYPLSQNPPVFQQAGPARKRGLDEVEGEDMVDNGPSNKKAKKAKKDEKDEKPKKSTNSFICYRRAHSLQVKAEFPGIKNGAVSKLLAERWRALPDADKKPWKDEAAKLASDHEQLTRASRPQAEAVPQMVNEPVPKPPQEQQTMVQHSYPTPAAVSGDNAQGYQFTYPAAGIFPGQNTQNAQEHQYINPTLDVAAEEDPFAGMLDELAKSGNSAGAMPEENNNHIQDHLNIDPALFALPEENNNHAQEHLNIDPALFAIPEENNNQNIQEHLNIDPALFALPEENNNQNIQEHLNIDPALFALPEENNNHIQEHHPTPDAAAEDELHAQILAEIANAENNGDADADADFDLPSQFLAEPLDANNDLFSYLDQNQDNDDWDFDLAGN
ncbi:hypothetical protein F5Y12DRAFT_794566 [Xylaria sp. FL1777]|nr:hypothetical protein F5Y12DRAFT_794566 [Xylaria sp. FL1777]